MARHKKPSGGLTKWFREGWVDISRKRKGGGFMPCGRKSARNSKRGFCKILRQTKTKKNS